ncbi:MAG: hypothetical protein CME06_00385 [Gemmatimonadetes bacterium]|nr:hypothetical protein [Gemmatimonadota bacterium]
MGTRLPLAALAGPLLTGFALARTLDVPGDSETIAGAMDAAASGDTVLVHPGTYVEQLTFDAKGIVVTGTDPLDTLVVAATVVDGASQGTVVSFIDGADRSSVLQGLLITGGTGQRLILDPHWSPSWAAGGIYCEADTSPWIRDCIIRGNSVMVYPWSIGGGVFCFQSSPLIERCSLDRNVTSGGGGVLHASQASPTILGCRIAGNSGTGLAIARSEAWIDWCRVSGRGEEAAFTGLGILDSDVRVSNSAFTKNLDKAIIASSWNSQSTSRVLIEDCTIAGNESTAMGGGIQVRDNGTEVRIQRCAIIGNRTTGSPNDGHGGGLMQGPGRGHLEITNSLIAWNEATGRGGGIAISDGTALLSNCLVLENAAADQGGGLRFTSSDSTLQVLNCTITGNWAGLAGGAVETFSRGLEVSSCIMWENFPDAFIVRDSEPAITYSDIEGGWPGEGNIDADPHFRSFQGVDYLLSPGSPCIDAGDPTIEDGVSDWHPRWPAWYPNGARSDMGAFGGPGNIGWLP